MPATHQRRDTRRSSPDAVERLYVLWLVGTLLLAFGTVVVVFFTRGALRSQNEAMIQIVERLHALETRVADLDRDSASAPSVGDRESDRYADRRSVPKPVESPPSSAPADATSPRVVDDTEVNALLAKALRFLPQTGYQLADAGAARQAVDLARGLEPVPNWPGKVWADLALSAELLADEAAARLFGQRAEAAGDPAVAYLELAVERALDDARMPEAAAYARLLVERTEGLPLARLFLAEVQLRADRWGAAADAVALVTPSNFPDVYDRLRLGRVYLAVEQWAGLAAVVAGLPDLPEPLARERDFQRAVLLIQQAHAGGADRERLVEAAAVLDYLLGDKPDDYDFRTWRGVALTQARQYEAARLALDGATGLQPGRPEAWYWRGVVEIKAQKPRSAAAFLQKALVASVRYAPTWETLGLLALNEGNVSAALENLANAINAHPGRASAHFLAAVAHAKASRRDDAVNALRSAIRLDPVYAREALRTDVIVRLIEPAQIDAMLAEPAAADPAGEAGSTEDNRTRP